MICLQTLKHLDELLIQKFFNWNILKSFETNATVVIKKKFIHGSQLSIDPKIQNIIVLCTFVNKNVRKPNKKDLHIPLINKSKKKDLELLF